MPKAGHVSVSRASDDALSISVSVPLQLIKEKKRVIAYCAALDLSTFGKTEKEAEKNFDEVVQIFFDEIIEEGTLVEALQELGWTKKNQQWEPPVEIRHTVTIPLQAAIAAR